jgi:hypothetical protein
MPFLKSIALQRVVADAGVLFVASPYLINCEIIADNDATGSAVIFSTAPLIQCSSIEHVWLSLDNEVID